MILDKSEPDKSAEIITIRAKTQQRSMADVHLMGRLNEGI
jgi:hypothetical protein